MKNEINEELNEAYEFIETDFNLDDVTFIIYYTHGFDREDIDYQKLDHNKKVPDSFLRNSMHTHPFCEMFISKTIEFDLIFNNETVRVHTGNAVIIPDGIEHTANYDGQSKAISVLFSYAPNTLYKPNGLYDTLSSVLSAPYVYVSGSYAERVIDFYKYLGEHNVIMASRCFYDIITDALLANGQIPNRQASSKISDSEISRTRRITNLIDKYYSYDISLDFLAKRLNLSVRHTSRIIKAQLGKTLGEIVLEKRMQAAEGLLLNSGLAVSEIAARVGYNSLSCFYAAFKDYYGTLPKEYKKQHLSEEK